MVTLLSDRKDFCGDGSHMYHFLRQTFAEDGFRLQNFRHGEAPWQERELRTLVPLTLEVERNRNAATFAAQVLKFQATNTAPPGFSQPDSLYLAQCNLVLCPVV